MVVPLTTYTKERWNKCKKSGFGCRIRSTNSIARVDKYRVVNRTQIKSRYYNSNRILIADPTELNDVITKLQEYVRLSDEKALREYSKYKQQKNDYLKELQDLFIVCAYDASKYSIINNASDVIITHDKCIVSHLAIDDLYDTIDQVVGVCKRTIHINVNTVNIQLQKTSNFLLTFSDNYDMLMLQKSSSNT